MIDPTTKLQVVSTVLTCVIIHTTTELLTRAMELFGIAQGVTKGNAWI